MTSPALAELGWLSAFPVLQLPNSPPQSPPGKPLQMTKVPWLRKKCESFLCSF
jgi:hypothetical protein